MASQDWLDKDFYAVLGVDKTASDADIKKSYRKLARQFHPDSNPNNLKAEARFKEISQAYSVLSDTTQRQEYDQIRAMGSGARFTAPGAGRNGGFEDVFGNLFGHRGGGAQFSFSPGRSNYGQYDDLFAPFGGAPTPSRGQDVTASATLDFLTATQGDSVALQSADGRTITVRVPPGVEDGKKIRVRGKGHPSPSGGDPGDLILTVQVRPHPVFERDGLNLRLTVPVTFAEAALGATISVPTLGGDPIKLRIPPGTPSGRVLRAKGRGVVTANGSGDLLAVLQVAVPDNLSADAEEKLAAFAAALPKDDPREDLLARARLPR